MKRSEKGTNTFSQTIKEFDGRLYSFKMFACDYYKNDLTSLKPRKKSKRNESIATVSIVAEIDPARSFNEVYTSEPRPKTRSVLLILESFPRQKRHRDLLWYWADASRRYGPANQEQAFNFLELSLTTSD